MHVHLVHGMGRTPFSMSLLGRRLAGAGHVVHAFGYRVARESLAEITARFVAHVTSHSHDGETYAVVGHSLGGVVTRLASPSLPPGFARFVMLAPPNASPSIARRLHPLAVFRSLTRDAGDKLADPGFFATLPRPDVPTLVIAGTRGPKGAWHPHAGSIGDGVVTVEEARLDGAEHLEVDAIHTFIMNHREVTRAVIGFIESTS